MRDAGALPGGLMHLPGNPADVLLDVRAHRELTRSHPQGSHRPIIYWWNEIVEAKKGTSHRLVSLNLVVLGRMVGQSTGVSPLAVTR